MSKNTNSISRLIDGFHTAAISSAHQSNLAYRPEFLSNDPAAGRKVLVSIEQELAQCDEFKISVAFITKSGITPLLQMLKELERRGVPGKILTTDYLLFSDPSALDTINGLNNIELRMYRTGDDGAGFHTKGYIFRQEELYRIIIGSSNMTLSAVTRNIEWNTKIVSTGEGELAKAVLSEFESLWCDSHTVNYQDCCEDYRLAFLRGKMIREQRRSAMKDQVVQLDRVRLEPNKMQVAFIENLLKLQDQNARKALLCSATGTGKSFASAFAARELKPARMLFLVHREQIARQAMASYRRVFGAEVSYGLLSGNSREMEADCLFSTMQMMAKPEIHTQFPPDAFDFIVLDECHHAGADSYQRIMAYFKPDFWLGMTASPDTTNYDIYELFDHNIACEIRLQQALEDDLLCPFHYFGITDLEINGQIMDDNTGLRNFAYLVSDERVRYIIEQAEYYGHSGDRVKGLIFCSRKDEARELSAKFNMMKKKNGLPYSTAVLTGEDSQERREEMIARLVADEASNFGANKLDYIFSVDVFNEGVDVPEVNQIIMLRPTQSPVVFVQQLGRGLRKFKDKEYVVILDFIGNYTNNFMIPIALSGDRSYNKDTMRRYVREGARIIPGSSTIHFDEISRKRIYASIDSAKTNDMRLLRDSYTALKYKLGRIPTVLDFKEYGSIDVMKIFEKCNSYHSFLCKYEPDYCVKLREDQEIVIEYLSKKLVGYKRVYEVALLHHLITHSSRLEVYFQKFIEGQFGVQVTGLTEESVYRNLTNAFPKNEERKKYEACVLVNRDAEGRYALTPEFQAMLLDGDFLSMVQDLLTFGMERWQECYSCRYSDTDFQLYQKYTYEDVCRLLGWKNNMNAQNIGGYFYDADTRTMPVFINYHKSEDAIAYEDRFVSESELIALSKHPRKVTSGDADHIYKRRPEDADNRIFLFVRKNKDDKEAKEFYFLGEIFAVGEPFPIHMESTKDDAFEIHYRLDVPVRSDIYDYIVRD